MAKCYMIARSVTTSLTRDSLLSTLNTLAAAIRDEFKPGGNTDLSASYDLSVSRAWVQWDNADFEVVIEFDSISAILNTEGLGFLRGSIETGLKNQSSISAAPAASVTVIEQSTAAAV